MIPIQSKSKLTIAAALNLGVLLVAHLVINMHYIRMTIEDIVYDINHRNKTLAQDGQNFMHNMKNPSTGDHKVQYICPQNIGTAKNDKNDYFNWYDIDTRKHRDGGKFDFDNFMDQTYAGWGLTPKQRKDLARSWIHWYADNLKPGDTVYESAVGAGLTLYVYLELLRENYGIKDLEVHGNDYLPDLLGTTNRLFYEQELLNHVKKGQFCQGDSTNLKHVPSSSFDLAFTGYVNPIEDPLNLGAITGFLYCVTGLRKDLIAKEYQIQEDWIASWATELLRIVKPGGTVILEGVAHERCDALMEWGGVKREWWKSVATHEKYGWDVDPSSVEIIDFDSKHKYGDQVMHMNGVYNVKMSRRIHYNLN